MPKIITFSRDELERRLKDRLEWAKEARLRPEAQWRYNKEVVDEPASMQELSNTSVSFDSLSDLTSEIDESQGDYFPIGTNFVFKNVRFLHSQFSANPPSATASPTSSDLVDRRRADAADRILRHGERDKNVQEAKDEMLLNTLKKGIGWIKLTWDPNRGDVFDFNEETEEISMTGDMVVDVPLPENVWIDSDASRWDDVRYTFEVLRPSIEEAVFRFPEAAELIKKHVEEKKQAGPNSYKSSEEDKYEPHVEIYEYYEKGMPINGMIGLRAYILADGTLLESPTKNPHYKAKLPLKPLTYVDMEDSLYGKSIVDYAGPIQEVLNRLDTSFLENIKAGNNLKLVVPKEAGIENGDIDDQAQIVEVEGTLQPHWVGAAQMMPDAWRFRESQVIAIDTLFGINDSMLGIQRREQSAVSQQTSIEQGLAIHRRLFSKYSLLIKEFYTDYLGLARTHWDEPRTIAVLGKEKALESADFKGADISGGYDIEVDHGTSLPQDPIARREFLTVLTPLLKESGMSAKAILRRMKLNDVVGTFDRFEMAAERQREIFTKMELSFADGDPEYIAPEEGEDHLSRLEFARDYVESAEFRDLPKEVKTLIKQHVKDRKALAAAEAATPPGGDPKETMLVSELGLAPQASPSVVPLGSPGVGGAMPAQLGTEPINPLEESGIV